MWNQPLTFFFHCFEELTPDLSLCINYKWGFTSVYVKTIAPESSSHLVLQRLMPLGLFILIRMDLLLETIFSLIPIACNNSFWETKLVAVRKSSCFPAFSPCDHGAHFIHLSASTIVCLLSLFSSCYCWQLLPPVWAAIVPWSLFSCGFRLNWLFSFRCNFMSARTINKTHPKACSYCNLIACSCYLPMFLTTHHTPMAINPQKRFHWWMKC